MTQKHRAFGIHRHAMKIRLNFKSSEDTVLALLGLHEFMLQHGDVKTVYHTLKETFENGLYAEQSTTAARPIIFPPYLNVSDTSDNKEDDKNGHDVWNTELREKFAPYQAHQIQTKTMFNPGMIDVVMNAREYNSKSYMLSELIQSYGRDNSIRDHIVQVSLVPHTYEYEGFVPYTDDSGNVITGASDWYLIIDTKTNVPFEWVQRANERLCESFRVLANTETLIAHQLINTVGRTEITQATVEPLVIDYIHNPIVNKEQLEPKHVALDQPASLADIISQNME